MPEQRLWDFWCYEQVDIIFISILLIIYLFMHWFIYKCINLIYIFTYSFIIIIICTSVSFLRLFDDTCSQHPVRVLHFADLCYYENDLFRWTFIFNVKPLFNFLNLYIFPLVIFLYHFRGKLTELFFHTKQPNYYFVFSEIFSRINILSDF